jgi:hypothetical protein
MFFGVFPHIPLGPLSIHYVPGGGLGAGEIASACDDLSPCVCVCFVWKSECVRDDDVTGALVAQPKQQTHHRTHNQHTLCQLVS